MAAIYRQATKIYSSSDGNTWSELMSAKNAGKELPTDDELEQQTTDRILSMKGVERIEVDRSQGFSLKVWGRDSSECKVILARTERQSSFLEALVAVENQLILNLGKPAGILKPLSDDAKALAIVEELRKDVYRVVLNINCDTYRCIVVPRGHDSSVNGEGKTLLEAVTNAKAAHAQRKNQEFWKTHSVKDEAGVARAKARMRESYGDHFKTADFVWAVVSAGGPSLTPDQASMLLSACPYVVRLSTPDCWYLLPGDCQRKD